MDDWDRLAPISLAVESPILHLVLNAALADAELFKLFYSARDRVLLVRVTVEKVRIYHLAVAGVGFLSGVSALYYLDNINAELLCEVEVAGVVRGDRHDRARAVAHHNIVGDVDGDLLAGEGILRRETLKPYARLVLDELGALEFGLLRTLRAVGFDRVHVLYPALVLVDRRMLGSHDHEGHAEERVGAGRVDA